VSVSQKLLAHSERRDPPIPSQLYNDHVESVRRRAVKNAHCATEYFRGDREVFVDVVNAAALYHDLGKLDEQNQAVLRVISHKPLPVAHEDAGVEQLLRLKRMESAVLVAAHHAGLFSREKEQGKNSRAFRNMTVAEHVDGSLASYIEIHAKAVIHTLNPLSTSEPIGKCGFKRRLALSCLVDADYGDTARHYQEEPDAEPPAPRWAERIVKLQEYVTALPAGENPRQRQRNQLRRKAFEACLNAPIDPAIRACDAPVGCGKTTAVMAHLLKVAAEKGLRHVIVVLPYTNIIQQSVDTYRKALVLDGERAEEIVAEHHHQADFTDPNTRHLATLWKAPIIVTTAVQFFETIANHHPARLRKMHELPGSAVFIDETHAAMPSHLWPQMWRWLGTWTRDWGGHIVFASGSLPRFWELCEFVNPPKAYCDVPDLLPDALRNELESAEAHRIMVHPIQRAMSCGELIDFVQEQPGPRLVILNTVQSAAVIANAMRQANHNVLHLSTALAPIHRQVIVQRVKNQLRLKHQGITDWTLVATSCVEAGLDFSFRSGFRESCSVSSLIQVGGRVSRENEHDDGNVWHFRVNDPELPPHPGFQVAQRVLDAMLQEKWFERLPPASLAKEAMRRECTEGGYQKAQNILKAEDDMEYPTVSKLCRVIDTDTRIVIIDPILAKRLQQGKPVDRITLLRHSVQMWTNKLRQFAVDPVWPEQDFDVGLFVWRAEYDPDFLGYMAGALPLLKGLRDAIFVA
jgi:CRISPR-associated endonuclease/helicase Cas3